MAVVITLMVIGAILQGTFICVEHKEKYVLADILKGSAAACFVAIGVLGYLNKTHDSFGLKLMIGLIFGMIGDILLNLRFVVGEDNFRTGIIFRCLANSRFKMLSSSVPEVN